MIALTLIAVLMSQPTPVAPQPGSTDPGESPICTQMGCVNRLTLRTQPMNYRWQPGNYVFEFGFDGRQERCESKLPFPGCDAGSTHCTTADIVLTESGCAGAPETHGYGPLIQIQGAPKQVSVKVSRDGTVIGDGTWTPEYRKVQPNGPSCEPICKQSSGVLELK